MLDDDTLGEDDVVFIYQEDPDCLSQSQLKDISLGGQFVFRGEVFTKTSTMGWCLGVCNITDTDGNVSHLHPSTRVSLLQ